jgi:hypothetical protein
MKHISPQLGFNNNVRHKGHVFHIQTEDSGVKHPHVITHLFADGGRILKSTKTSYAEFLGEDDLAKKVRGLMQEQHKAMFIALRAGKFDHMLPDAEASPEQVVAKSAEGAQAPAPVEAVAPIEPVAPVEAVVAAPSVESVEEVEPPKAAVPEPPPSDAGRSRPLLSALASQPPSSRSRLTPPPPKKGEPLSHLAAPTKGGVARGVEPFAPTMPGIEGLRPVRAEEPQRAPASAKPGRHPSFRPAAAQRPPLSESLELDLEALERAAEQTNSPVYQQLRDLPPPPATLLRPSASRNTSYRSVTPQAPQMIKEPARHAPSKDAPPSPEPASRSDKDHRYSHSRPASIFGPTRPLEGSSIFGEDLISEKSLDEVILGYLAEDLEPSAKK